MMASRDALSAPQLVTVLRRSLCTRNDSFFMRSDMTTSTMQADHSEGTIARSIEQQTAKLPSDTFLWAAGAAIGTSLTLQIAGKQHASQFIGQWAPTLLILGLYNKLVKQLGSDGERVASAAR
jgi:hypothetical protein